MNASLNVMYLLLYACKNEKQEKGETGRAERKGQNGKGRKEKGQKGKGRNEKGRNGMSPFRIKSVEVTFLFVSTLYQTEVTFFYWRSYFSSVAEVTFWSWKLLFFYQTRSFFRQTGSYFFKKWVSREEESLFCILLHKSTRIGCYFWGLLY